MLAISQTLNYCYCVEWVPSETGPRVIKYKRYNQENFSLEDPSSIENLIKDFKPISKDESNALTISIDINSVGMTSLYIDEKYDNIDYIKWYEKNILGEDFLEFYDTYYYSFNLTQLLVLFIKKTLKNNIINSTVKSGYKLIHFSLDFFSANNFVKKEIEISNFLLWKIDNNNIHWFLFNLKNEKGKFSYNTIMKIRINPNTKKIKNLFNIGDSMIKESIMTLINDILFKETKSENLFRLINKVYVYQNKTDLSLIREVIKKDYKEIEVIDLSQSLFKNFKIKTNPINLSGFCGIGNSLRGIDV